ncbi:acetyltransferase (GNAT) family protein [Nocardioides albertanoniae]|uniref:Acetyltransferase (GNAT) family protein n=1 Tax=Nocardioides albertanoniae TaxID=1175486 RepID=A0A543AAU9_9ACTN|nr:GNAT family N-acetyltransferase [Nocardioides albertanoniae]TQL69732.1 acetyltransferase (GNAT) family protein [Nocardioides albertanoniae]
MPAHLLGPHVVGKRIVVRRLVTGESGPTGGPAFTDILGTCLAWADGTAVIERESGERVSVPVSEIVSGKPVPPRPNVRLRIGVREAELLSAAIFPGTTSEPLGEWTLFDHEVSVRRRPNSALAIGDPGVGLDEAIDRVETFYRSRHKRPRAKVEVGSAVEDALVSRGWHEDVTVEFRLAGIAAARRLLPPPVEDAELEINGSQALFTFGDTARIMGTIERDWLAIHDLEVAEPHRRQGVATKAVATLLEWGAEQGARAAWLHVETTNDAGLALYEGLGFAEHHRCRYYASPTP